MKRLRYLLKAKAAEQYERRTWADGYTRMKVGKKWVVVSSASEAKERAREVEEKTEDTAQAYFDRAMTTNLGDVVEDVLVNAGVKSYEDLVDKVKKGPPDTAHKLFRKVVDTVRASTGTDADKKAAIHLIGTALVDLNTQYADAKATLTVKKTSKTGKEYYTYEKTEGGPPTLKASAVAAAKKKMGGWSVTGDLTSAHVNKMISAKSAKLVSGKINPKKKWVMPDKAKDMEFRYKGNSLKVQVKQVKKVGKQTRATAKVDIEIPYVYVHAFLKAHVTRKRTRDDFLFRIEHSQGYRNFLERAAA